MNEQLELAIRAEIDSVSEIEKAKEDCAKLLFDGKTELHFAPEMTVGQVWQIWEDLHGEKLDAWEARYKAGIDECLAKLKELGPRARKERAPVNRELARLHRLSEIGRSMNEGAYEPAIVEVDEIFFLQWQKRKIKPSQSEVESACDDLWHSITDRHAVEDTWHWTLQDAADVAIAQATNQDAEISENEEFRIAYLRARKRENGKINLTRSECYFGCGLVARCASITGEKVYGADGKPLKKAA